MKPFRQDTQLATIPAGAFIQLFQTPGSSKNNEPAVVPASLVALAADLDAAIAGSSSTPVATADGLTTGLIAATAQFLTPTSAAAVNILTLPAAVAGKIIRIVGPVNGCELRSAVAGDKVNSVVVGATNEAALVAGTLYTLRYDGTDNWVMDGLTALGAVEAPVIPDVV